MSSITLHQGDNRETLRRLIAAGVRVDSVVTDPPYGLVSITKRFGKDGAAPALSNGATGVFGRAAAGFMGSAWDGTGIERDPEFWRLIWEILLPGGYCLAFSGARTGHWQACAMEQAGFIMHPLIGWTFGCMDPETECLTRRGWLHYSDLLGTDEVLQWCSGSDRLTWTQPQHIHEYDFDGDMVLLENRHTRQMLTPNHRVYAKIRTHSRYPTGDRYSVHEASDLHNRSSAWQVNLPMAAVLEGGAEIDPDYAYLVGWWLTDAWPHRDANACMFSQCKPLTLEKLRAALAPYKPAEYIKTGKLEQHADEHTFYLTGDMADKLREEFPERRLPWEVLSWSLAARRRLYDGLMDGDGSQPTKQHAHTFWAQSSAERRDVFLALALSLGHRSFIGDGGKGAVYVNQKTSTTQLQHKHRSKPVRYVGKVWCLTVPTGAFVVRRDGRPFITGNSGFPKAHDAAKAIDKLLGAQGALVPTGAPVRRMVPGADQHRTGQWDKPAADQGGREYQPGDYEPAAAAAVEWQGWAYGAQTLKPALEPIYIGQKPFSEKTGAANLVRHGVGAFNLNGCRVQCEAGGRPAREVAALRDDVEYAGNALSGRVDGSLQSSKAVGTTDLGRHPANLITDASDAVRALFPDSGGSGAARKLHRSAKSAETGWGMNSRASDQADLPDAGSGSAARFFNAFPLAGEDWSWFVEPDDYDALTAAGIIADPGALALYYHAKASLRDRVSECTSCGAHVAGAKPACDCRDASGNRTLRSHPTVKPVALMQHLVRLVTPPGGTVLDPFAGTGTTGAAARAEGFDCVLMEAEDAYCRDIRVRLGLGAGSQAAAGISPAPRHRDSPALPPIDHLKLLLAM